MRHAVKSVVCVARDTGFVCLPLPSCLASRLASVSHFLPEASPTHSCLRAQVKWTHLSKEDTTAKNEFGKAEALWGGDAKLAKKYEARMAGTKAANDFSRPAGKRRK